VFPTIYTSGICTSGICTSGMYVSGCPSLGFRFVRRGTAGLMVLALAAAEYHHLAPKAADRARPFASRPISALEGGLPGSEHAEQDANGQPPETVRSDEAFISGTRPSWTHGQHQRFPVSSGQWSYFAV